ncbi:lysylphosphatidylglycerol synthase transmembrane domain-containing protein [Natronorarus salvus]|uniref:lysylphosphatidylglycerol synthase transmembrane domain-containing protein n=1 Tax=Natronorarus salvus TaxID=3117733 RepID=UPI002F26265C
MKRRALLALGLALLVLGLFVLVVGWEEVLGAIRHASLRIYALAFVATVGCLLCRAYVWHRVLAIVDRPRPYWLVVSVFLAGTFGKYVLPYGQVTSGVGVAAVVSRYYDSEYEEGLAAVVSADFLNYLPYYTLGAVGVGYLLHTGSSPVALDAYLRPAGVALAVVGLVLVVVWHRRDGIRSGAIGAVASLRGAVSGVSPRVARQLRRENLERRFEGFSETLELVSRNRRSGAVAVLSAHVAWLGLAGALYATAHAVGSPLPFGLAILGVALSKLGFLVPTPGGVGGVEIALASVLVLVAPIGFATATAIAILYRFATYWFTILVGGATSVALTLKDPTPPEAE